MTPVLYIASNGLSVWHSDDLGDTLTRLQSDSGMYSGSQVWALAHHPARPGELLAGTETGLYRMDRTTRCWTHLSSPMDSRLVTAIAQSPADPAVIVAGTQPGALFRSDDDGRSWQALDVPMKPHVSISVQNGRIRVPSGGGAPNIRHWTRVTQILFDPEEPRLVWAGVEIDAVWRSEDGGRSWRQTTKGLASKDIHGFALVRNGQRVLYATTNEGLHASRDDGETWTLQTIDSPWQYVRAIGSRADASGVMFMTNGDGPPGWSGRLFRSRDHGARWEDVRLPGEVQSSVYTLAAHPADPSLLFAATCLGQIYRTTDAGETWTALRRRLGEIRALAWLPS
jgi:photosystem II stability/assembly factor-like uncharacterized protein